MTKMLIGRNVNTIFTDALWWMKVAGVKEKSRNGKVLVAPGPVVSEYRNPTERLCFNPTRDANHVFHLMESIWMLAGQNDVSWLLPFNSRFVEYTEDGVTQHGAYGRRWRHHFQVDQIKDIIYLLRTDPESRRAVMGMWDPAVDSLANVRDVPCNTHIYFDTRHGALNMTVCNRSNDMLWGAYGANVVHMSMLQEVIAAGVGLEVGVYRQFSNNMHIYTDNPVAQCLLENTPLLKYDLYATGDAKPVQLIQLNETVEDFLVDCVRFVEQESFEDDKQRLPYRTAFMRNIAQPLYNAYLERRAGGEPKLDDLYPCDWTTAFTLWADRRDSK